jgi:hypothetical protein
MVQRVFLLSLLSLLLCLLSPCSAQLCPPQLPYTNLSLPIGYTNHTLATLSCPASSHATYVRYSVGGYTPALVSTRSC